MRAVQTVLAALVLTLPVVSARADALALSVCVLDKATFDSLLKQYGSVKKIPTADLWQKSVYKTFMDKSDGLATEFTHEQKSYKLLASRIEGKVLYSVAIGQDKDSRLVAAGSIPPGQEAKENTDGESFVVVARSGNFLLQ